MAQPLDEAWRHWHWLLAAQPPLELATVPALIDVTEYDHCQVGLLAALGHCLPVQVAPAWSGVRLLAYRLPPESQTVGLVPCGLGFTWQPIRQAAYRIGVVSSHLGRRLDLHRYWFVALRSALSLPVPGAFYLVGARAPTARWAARWAQLTGQPVGCVRLEFDLSPGSGHTIPEKLVRCLGRPSLAEARPILFAAEQRVREELSGVPSKVAFSVLLTAWLTIYLFVCLLT
ncbi:MAG: hypothetical protein KatS3mg110_0311 [Pirellulaceae bacterium]|nr:MAG: hypothetical protein KatS3mg110_0311 [Pirellulaceae bacterium]